MKLQTQPWIADKARRDARIAAGQCPMCGKPKREQDVFDSDACAAAFARGDQSNST